jgi:hypothetical protein
MNLCFARVSVVLGFLAAVSAANAFVWTLSADLSGLNEVPANASPAHGTAMGSYDDVSNLLMLDVDASGFLAPTIAGHIHEGPVGANGPVRVPFTGTFGQTSYMNHEMAVLTPAVEAALLAGNTYVNLHTTLFPGGEVRGQLRVVPEPISMLVMAAGMGGLLIRRRRKA